ncbi:MAG: hypothetical protein J5700_07060 [Treponema sp.]|nr:hypothetical protein [Treponema sp.]
MKKFVLTFAALACASFFSLAFFSCKKQGAHKNTPDPFEIEVSEEKKSAISSSSWHPSQKKICVVFGYGYNDKSYVQKIVDELSPKYGLDDGTEAGGLLFPLVFPDDFPMGRISRLPSLIGERELAGLIVIGAPENTNYAIAKLEDEYSSQETMIPYPVYAFFPQDDVQGIEATANFVVDRAMEGSGAADDESNKEEVVQTQVKDLDKILDSAIEYMLLTQAPLPGNEELIAHVCRVVGKNYKVSRYVDAESGLQSINHFVIEEK